MSPDGALGQLRVLASVPRPLAGAWHVTGHSGKASCPKREDCARGITAVAMSEPDWTTIKVACSDRVKTLLFTGAYDGVQSFGTISTCPKAMVLTAKSYRRNDVHAGLSVLSPGRRLSGINWNSCCSVHTGLKAAIRRGNGEPLNTVVEEEKESKDSCA
jgi:hypothetical protein